MSEQQSNGPDKVREQVEQIVAQGHQVREHVAKLVTETVERSHVDQEGLVGLARSVLQGAAAALERTVPHSPDSTLRQVVDGLGDGFSSAALACRLAFEEAQAQGRTFAGEDLAKMRTDFKALGDLFVATVSGTAGKFRSLAG